MLRPKRAWRAVGGASLHVMEKPPPSAHSKRARVPRAVPHDAKSPSGFAEAGLYEHGTHARPRLLGLNSA